ncbi:MAG: cadmium resistance transporter [Cyanobacteriota bacterium]|jgi:cadmium resistance protein CadD (predicted permease)|nr:cadmium resistance transporter [Cyanobacteriota bacterium]
MEHPATVVGAALVLFASTNIDDLLLMVVLQSDHRRRYPPLAILVGQMLGFGAILAISMLGFLSGQVIPQAWLACLGVLPLAMGVRQGISLMGQQRSADGSLEEARQSLEQAVPALSSNRRTIARVASLTLANGSDNVSVYLPLFGRLDPPALLLTLGTFLLALAGLWVLAHWLAHHRRWRHRLQRFGPRVAPVVLISLGIWLLRDSWLWDRIVPLSP